MRCVEFRTQLLLGIRKHLSPWQLKAAVQVILNACMVTHIWAETICARLPQSLCIQVYICSSLPSVASCLGVYSSPKAQYFANFFANLRAMTQGDIPLWRKSTMFIPAEMQVFWESPPESSWSIPACPVSGGQQWPWGEPLCWRLPG